MQEPKSPAPSSNTTLSFPSPPSKSEVEMRNTALMQEGRKRKRWLHSKPFLAKSRALIFLVPYPPENCQAISSNKLSHHLISRAKSATCLIKTKENNGTFRVIQHVLPRHRLRGPHPQKEKKPQHQQICQDL